VPINTPKPVPAVPMPAKNPATCSPPGKLVATIISSRPEA
jgi:hypothetical protein